MLHFRLSTYLRRAPLFLIRTSTLATSQIRSLQTTRLDLDQLLERLDGEAHRRGLLNPGLVRGAMNKAAIELNTINSTQALLLIRCTGSLLISELPRQRQQVLDHMMNIFKQKNVVFDVTHYNSYMRVSLQNNYFFDPMKMLDEMRKVNIAPNLTSFRLFIECYARQGRSDDIQKMLSEMKMANFNIEPLILTHLLNSYAQKGNIERVENLFHLFNELELKPISETYEQFIIGYLKHGKIDQAKKYFVENVSKMDNETLFRLIIKCAECQQKDFFEVVINSIDKNSLADICVQYILCATELIEANLDDYAFLLIDSFPKRDETLRFDLINLTILNLLKIRLPTTHFRPFSTLTIDDINNNLESSINYQCERESVTDEQLNIFRQSVLKRVENFIEEKDRWLAIHQLLYHAYQSHIPLPYIYAIYDTMRQQKYEYRPHYMRPIILKIQRIFAKNPQEITNQTRELLNYLQKNFSINYDHEIIDFLIEYFFDQCQLKPVDIALIFKKVNIHLNHYWSNLYLITLKRINIDLLRSLTAFLNANKTIRFEYTTVIREQTIQTMQSLINQLSINQEKSNAEEIFNQLKVIIDFIDLVNRRFVKNSNDLIILNDCVLISIVNWFLEKEDKHTINLLKKILKVFEQRSQTIPLTNETKEKIYEQLGIKSLTEVNDQLIKTFKRDQVKYTKSSSPDRSFFSDDSSDIYIKSTKTTRNLTIRELEDHLIELKRKKLNTSGIISKLLSKYCTECLDSERIMTNPVREDYMKRISELETIYFDKKQTTGFPSVGVIAILIDYYSRVELNLDKVIYYINLSNEIEPKFKLDPHKCVSVIRLLIRKNLFNRAIELIDSLGQYEVVPNYMYRRVRDLLLDAYSSIPFEQFQYLVNKLIKNNYVDPSSTVMTLIVRKSYHDNGPLQAFETVKNILAEHNNLVGMFPIIRKLLRDDCTEELKQVLIKIGKIRSRTFAYEQLAFALIHEHRFPEAVKVYQHISRSTFEEHCQRYVRELFYFPSDLQHHDDNDETTSSTITTTNDIYECNHVFDTDTISLVNFIEYIEQYPSNTRHLSIDTLFYSLFKAYEKTNRLDEFTKLMRNYSSKYIRYFSSKTKDALSQAGISLQVKSLSSPKQSTKHLHKHERFLNDHDYEEDSPTL